MRIVVMSDSHMMVSALLDIIERHKNNADLFLFLGDGNKDLDTALQLHPDIKIDRVSGNCDFMSDLPASKVIECKKYRKEFLDSLPADCEDQKQAMIDHVMEVLEKQHEETEKTRV